MFTCVGFVSPFVWLRQLPAHIQPGDVGQLFKGEPGFQEFRNRRRMCFVDFSNTILGACVCRPLCVAPAASVSGGTGASLPLSLPPSSLPAVRAVGPR